MFSRLLFRATVTCIAVTEPSPQATYALCPMGTTYIPPLLKHCDLSVSSVRLP